MQGVCIMQPTHARCVTHGGSANLTTMGLEPPRCVVLFSPSMASSAWVQELNMIIAQPLLRPSGPHTTWHDLSSPYWLNRFCTSAVVTSKGSWPANTLGCSGNQVWDRARMQVSERQPWFQEATPCSCQACDGLNFDVPPN